MITLPASEIAMPIQVSAFFEGYAWHAETWISIAFSLAGNVIILRKT